MKTNLLHSTTEIQPNIMNKIELTSSYYIQIYTNLSFKNGKNI